MGMEAEDDPFSSDMKFPNDNCTMDVPLDYQIFGDMNPSYDFSSVLSSDDLNAEPLSDSLLNKGLQRGYTPFDLTPPEASHCDNENSAIDNLSSASGNDAFNTNFGYNFNHPLQTYTPFTARIPSSLRNEYLLGDSYGSSSVMGSFGQQNHITSSPSNYKINNTRIGGQHNSRNPQSFLRGDLHSQLNQSESYNTGQQSNLNPRQLHPIYNGQQRHSYHPSGQLIYGIAPQALLNDARPCTPPGQSSPLNVGINVAGMSSTSPADVVIKRETLASGSPLAKKRPRKGSRREAVEQHAINDDDSLFIDKSESVYVKELVKAMTDGATAEDNPGMQTTWDKIRENKADKVHEKCVELLGLIKRAQHEQLVDKKAVNTYRNFDHRFDETCAALRTQKTVCKHLMESPYSHIVANDPTYAAQRVRNNRRVNGQKRQAITMGRQALGLQGQGKGKGMKKIEPVPFDDLFEDGEDSGDDLDADEEDPMEAPIPVVKVESSGRKKAKKARKSDFDDDNYEDSASYSPPSKKAKLGRRSTIKAIGDAQNVGNAQPSTKSNPASHHLELNRHQHGSEQPDYYTTGTSYGAMAPKLPSLPQEFYNNDYHHGSHFSPFNNPLGYSPNTDFDHVDNYDGGNDANASGSRI